MTPFFEGPLPASGLPPLGWRWGRGGPIDIGPPYEAGHKVKRGRAMAEDREVEDRSVRLRPIVG